MRRAALEPSTFLARGLARRLAASSSRTAGSRRGHADEPSPVVLSGDLARLLGVLGGRRFGTITPRPTTGTFTSLLAAARRGDAGRARLLALLGGAIPFGVTRNGELLLHVVGDGGSPARGAVVRIHPGAPRTPALVATSPAQLAVLAALDEAERAGDASATEVRARMLEGAPSAVAAEEAVRTAFDRASCIVDLLVGDDAAVRRAARKLAPRPLDVPHPPRSLKSARGRRDAGGGRETPLALGPVVEAFFRGRVGDDELVRAHATSDDALVREAVLLLLSSHASKGSKASRDLARRRAITQRATRTPSRAAGASTDRAELTRRIVACIDALPPGPEPATHAERQEAMLALGELGDPSALPALVARAVTGDVAAVEMLGALGDPRATSHLLEMLERPASSGVRVLETALVRSLTDLRAQTATTRLRALLEESPLTGWREGIEKATLVRELVGSLGTLRDAAAAPLIERVLAATSQEYRTIVPVAAWALGRLRHAPALPHLERLLVSPKEAPSCEAIWAIGEIGTHAPESARRVREVLTASTGLEPGAEVVRLVALAKLAATVGTGPSGAETSEAVRRALWQPGFRAEETSRRKAWALRALAELAYVQRGEAPLDDDGGLVLTHDEIRYLVTRDDHRVRTSAQAAVVTWGLPLPRTRNYYAVVVDVLEELRSREALHEAVRDPLGVFRHNAAKRLAERGHPSSVRPLVEASARLFAEPETSTYEYDDAPAHLVAFVRALAKLNRPESNDLLLEVLRSGHHQVRAVIADNAPNDPRFIPALMAMLGDPRSFLRSRAERSLQVLGGTRPPTTSASAGAPL